MQQAQSLHPVQGFRLHAQTAEVVEDIRLNALQSGLCGFQAVRLHAEGQVLGLNKPVVAAGKLALQHPGVLGAELVEAVALQGDGDAPGVGIPRGGEVDEGELEADGGIEIVEEVAPAVENGGLVLVLVELVVDILKLHGFRVVIVRHAAHAVGVHPLKGDAVLGGLLSFILTPGSCNRRVNLLSLGSCELSCGGFVCGQSRRPPYPKYPAGSAGRRNCSSCTGAVWGAGSTPARCCG